MKQTIQKTKKMVAGFRVVALGSAARRRVQKSVADGQNWRGADALQRFFLSRPVRLAALSVGAMVLAMFADMGGRYLSVNLVSDPPFVGTALPVQLIPNWEKIGNADNTQDFSAYSAAQLTPLPDYSPADLQHLCATDANGHLPLRNECLAFTVMYLGTYDVTDFREGVGSHLGVDIRLPVGTPVHAVANGVVTRVAYTSSGYGRYVVVRHAGVPLPEGGRGMLYSAYAHLSESQVREGQIVAKGQQIAKSGNTGTSTGAHLHFQIDRDSAEYHPFWPFTNAQLASANLSFFSAVNAGLGMEDAREHTVSPLAWAAEHADEPAQMHSAAPADIIETSEEKGPPPEEVIAVVTAETAPNPAPEKVVASAKVADVRASTSPRIAALGSSATLQIELLDEDGNLIAKPQNPEIFPLRIGHSGSALPEVRELSAADFSDGVASVAVSAGAKAGSTRFFITSLNASFASAEAGLRVSRSAAGPFPDVPLSHEAAPDIAQLKGLGLISGDPSGNFRPQDSINRAEFVKILLGALGISPENIATSRFHDIPPGEWFLPFAERAARDELVNGYPDGSFGGARAVNRAEAFTILARAVDANPPKNTAFSDVLADSWYAVGADFAAQRGLFDFAADLFLPNQSLTRAEMATAIARFLRE